MTKTQRLAEFQRYMRLTDKEKKEYNERLRAYSQDRQAEVFCSSDNECKLNKQKQ